MSTWNLKPKSWNLSCWRSSPTQTSWNFEVPYEQPILCIIKRAILCKFGHNKEHEHLNVVKQQFNLVVLKTVEGEVSRKRNPTKTGLPFTDTPSCCFEKLLCLCEWVIDYEIMKSEIIWYKRLLHARGCIGMKDWLLRTEWNLATEQKYLEDSLLL